MNFPPDQQERFLVKKGDILVCEGGESGRTAIWRGELGECYYQKAIHRLRPLVDSCCPWFLLRFMRVAADRNLLVKFTSATSITHLTREKLTEVPVPNPDIEEQRRIAERFDMVDQKLDENTSSLAKLRHLKSALMQDLLTGRVSADSVDLDSLPSIH